MKSKSFFPIVRTFSLSLLLSGLALAKQSDALPNVLLILADDLGYGDIGANGAELVATPHIDRLARDGMRFTRAYTPYSVCSPTRYSLLTGRYTWRSSQHPATQVIRNGMGLAIEKGRETLATLFKKRDYATAIIGKWHLGIGDFKGFNNPYDWSADKPIGPGPLDVGFDYYFGMSANVSNPPKFFIENREFVGRKPGDKVTMDGLDVIPWDPDVIWEDDEVAQTITGKAVDYIESHTGPDKPPFFLYFAANIPHSPIAPASPYQGSSQCGPYGDFIQELDAQIGQMLAAVEKARPHRETLIILTSDNGGVTTNPGGREGGSSIQAMEAGHEITGPYTGGKWSIYEGGFRVPFIVRWPGQVEPGQTNDNLVSLVDIFATLADMLGVTYGINNGEDSFSFKPQLIDTPYAPAARDHVILQSPMGVRALVRDGWKYIQTWEPPTDMTEAQQGRYQRELNNPENHLQLYHLDVDVTESISLLQAYPEIGEQMQSSLKQAEAMGRTTPGPVKEPTL